MIAIVLLTIPGLITAGILIDWMIETRRERRQREWYDDHPDD